jgi:hypothetical protein
VIALKETPAVWLGSAPGHYLFCKDDQAQIITVGRYMGRQAYLDAMPGYRIEVVEVMECPDPDLDGTFINVMMRRES